MIFDFQGLAKYHQIFSRFRQVHGEGPQSTRHTGAPNQIGCPDRVHNGTPLKSLQNNVRAEMSLKAICMSFIFGADCTWRSRHHDTPKSVKDIALILMSNVYNDFFNVSICSNVKILSYEIHMLRDVGYFR